MSEKRKPVICPCGKKMELHTFRGFDEFIPYEAYYHCSCGWVSPVRDGTTEAEAVEAAYQAAMKREPNDGNTSDGYHTFNELYHHRAVLFAVIVSQFPRISWKARVHDNGTMYDGMFIVGIDTPVGPATYHYDVDPYWDMFMCKELERAPKWDGHTPTQAIERIATLTSRPKNSPMTREQIEKSGLLDNDAVWIMGIDNKNIALHLISGVELKDLLWECRVEPNVNTWVWLRAKPSPADIEAARKEGNE